MFYCKKRSNSMRNFRQFELIGEIGPLLQAMPSQRKFSSQTYRKDDKVKKKMIDEALNKSGGVEAFAFVIEPSREEYKRQPGASKMKANKLAGVKQNRKIKKPRDKNNGLSITETQSLDSSGT